MTTDKWDTVFNTNLKGHFFLSQLIAGYFITKKKKGVILFISSVHQDVVQVEIFVGACVLRPQPSERGAADRKERETTVFAHQKPDSRRQSGEGRSRYQAARAGFL